MPPIDFARRTSIAQVEEGTSLAPRFDADGPIPVVTPDALTGEVLMMGLTSGFLRSYEVCDGSDKRKAALDQKGIRYGVGNSRQIRNCPRNCKRRANLRCHCPSTGMGRRRQAKTRESGDLPSKPMIEPGRGAPERVF